MSRSNPYKKPRRVAKQTVLFYGEGMGEEIFLKHLRGIYAQNSGLALTIRRGKGGTADGVVLSAIKYSGAFDRKVVVLDNDKSKGEMEKARQLAAQHSVILLENKPCLEALLLGILEPKLNFEGKTSTWCKQEFQKKYIEKKQRSQSHRYEDLFTKTTLDKARKRLKSLHEVILVMEGK